MMHIKPVERDAEWAMARAIRFRVFVEEQHCPPDEEMDEYDAQSRHFIGFAEDAPVATARWRRVLYGNRPAAKLERFAVVPEERGKGYGRRLVEHVLADVQSAGFDTQVLHAQAHLQAFYESFGFAAAGEPFVEAGIPHIRMVRGDSAA